MNDAFDWPTNTIISSQQISVSPAKESSSSHTPYTGAVNLATPTPHSIFTNLQNAFSIIEKKKLMEQKYRFAYYQTTQNQ